MEEYKCSWTCAGAHLLLWLAPGRMFPGNQILQCAMNIAVHLWYPRTLTVHIPQKPDIQILDLPHMKYEKKKKKFKYFSSFRLFNIISKVLNHKSQYKYIIKRKINGLAYPFDIFSEICSFILLTSFWVNTVKTMYKTNLTFSLKCHFSLYRQKMETAY